MKLKNELNENGVILVKNAWEKNDILDVSKEYDRLDQTLTNKEIIKDKPIIVFWKHVVGEQKRICTFDEFPSLWKCINNKIVPNNIKADKTISIFQLDIIINILTSFFGS